MQIKDIIQTLINAQTIADQIIDLTDQSERLPSQLASTKHRLAEVQEENNKLDTKIKLERNGIKKCEDEIAAIEKRISDLQNKQNEAKTNKDYKGFQDAIIKHRKEIDSFEEQILVHMDKIDELNEGKPSIDKKIKFQEDQLAKKKKELDENYDDLVGQINVLKDQKAEMFKDVIEETVELFDKLLEQRNGRAVVEVDDTRSCTGCHNELNVPTIQQLQATNEIVTCPSCGRIIYLAEYFN